MWGISRPGSGAGGRRRYLVALLFIGLLLIAGPAASQASSTSQASSSAQASASTLPLAFGGQITSNWSGDYHVCRVQPGTMKCYPDGPLDESDLHVSNDHYTLTVTKLRVARTLNDQYQVVGGAATLEGSAQDSWKFYDSQTQSFDTCTFKTTYTRGSGPVSGSMFFSTGNAPTAYLNLEVPATITYSNFSGNCNRYNKPSPTTAQSQRGPGGGQVSGPYRTNAKEIIFNQSTNNGNGTWTSNGKLTEKPAPPSGPPSEDDECEQKALAGTGEDLCSQCPNISVVPGQLANARDGQAYHEQLKGINGQPPYSFSLAGSLPTGLSLSSDGLLSGTVTAPPGTYAISFNMLDARQCSGSNQVFNQLVPQGFTLLLRVVSGQAVDTTAADRPPAARTSSTTSFSAPKWEIASTQAIAHAKPGSTYHYCSSQRVLGFELVGQVAHAHAGKTFTVKWSVNGHLRHAFHYRWLESGSYPTSLLIANPQGLPAGHWRFEISQGASGSSTLTVKKRSC